VHKFGTKINQDPGTGSKENIPGLCYVVCDEEAHPPGLFVLLSPGAPGVEHIGLDAQHLQLSAVTTGLLQTAHHPNSNCNLSLWPSHASFFLEQSQLYRLQEGYVPNWRGSD